VAFLHNLYAVALNLNPFLMALWVIFNQPYHKQPLGGYMDAVYSAVTLVFLALSWGFIVLCERL